MEPTYIPLHLFLCLENVLEIFFFQIAKLSAASPDTPPFDPRHRRIGRAMRFMETSAVVKKKEESGTADNRHIFVLPLQQLRMSFLRSCIPLA